jgi:hypothetical protein
MLKQSDDGDNYNQRRGIRNLERIKVSLRFDNVFNEFVAVVTKETKSRGKVNRTSRRCFALNSNQNAVCVIFSKKIQRKEKQ